MVMMISMIAIESKEKRKIYDVEALYNVHSINNRIGIYWDTDIDINKLTTRHTYIQSRLFVIQRILI